MSAGKSIKHLWAEKLDKLPLPAGSSFDKGSAWEKLQNQLEGKNAKQRKIAWIWWAAASVAASIILLIFLFSNHEQTGDKDHQSTQLQEAGPIAPREKDKRIAVAEQQAGIPLTNKNLPIHRPAGVPASEKKPGQENNINKDQPATVSYPQIPLTFSQPIDSGSAGTNTVAAAPVVVKKRLPVVHNNEIGGPAMIISPQEKNTTDAGVTNSFLPGFRKTNFEDHETFNDNPVKEIKSKKPILRISSLISQKE